MAQLVLKRCEFDNDFETQIGFVEQLETFSSAAISSCLRSLNNNDNLDFKETRSELRKLLSAVKIDDELTNNFFVQSEEMAAAYSETLYKTRRYNINIDIFYKIAHKRREILEGTATEEGTEEASGTEEESESPLHWKIIIKNALHSMVLLDKDDLVFHVIDNTIRGEDIDAEIFDSLAKAFFERRNAAAVIDLLYTAIAINSNNNLNSPFLGTCLLSAVKLRETLLAENMARLIVLLDGIESGEGGETEFKLLSEAVCKAIAENKISSENNDDYEVYNIGEDVSWQSEWVPKDGRLVNELCKSYKSTYMSWKAENLLVELGVYNAELKRKGQDMEDGFMEFITDTTFILVMDSIHPELRLMRKNLCRGEPLVSFYSMEGKNFENATEEDFKQARFKRRRM